MMEFLFLAGQEKAREVLAMSTSKTPSMFLKKWTSLVLVVTRRIQDNLDVLQAQILLGFSIHFLFLKGETRETFGFPIMEKKHLQRPIIELASDSEYRFLRRYSYQ